MREGEGPQNETRRSMVLDERAGELKVKLWMQKALRGAKE